MKKEYEIYTENERTIIKGLGYHEEHDIKDLRDLVNISAEKYGNKVAFKYKKNKEIVTKSYIDFKNDIEKLGTALYSLGLKDEKVAVISENRYEWGVSYLSVINGLGIGVPFDKYLPQNEIENLVERSKTKAIFFSKTYTDVMLKIAETNSNIKYYICFDEIETKNNKFYTLSKLLDKGEKLLKKGKSEYIKLPIDIDKVSILLFTSGTTSISKGVMLSQKNIVTNLKSVTSFFKAKEDDVHLSLLPLHHTFENTIGFLFMVHAGVCIAYCEGIKHIVDNLNEFNVTLLVAVPAIFETMYNKIQDGIKKSGKEELIKKMIKVSNGLTKVGIDLRKVFFTSIRKKFGHKLRLMVSGAAPLDTEIMKGYENFGIKLFQGYGLTETSPLVCVTDPYRSMYNTVGYPVKDVEVTIDSPDENGMGELLVRGGNVMQGYFENSDATKDAFTEDGWFRTGDLARINEENAIEITGRAKSMIVFTNGKKAFPEEYEMLINQIDGVKESYAWGNKAPDGDIQICAKIVTDNLTDEFIEKLDAKIKEINKDIPKYKIIRYFMVTDEELTKTTTLKIKRNIEKEKIEKYLEDKNSTMRKENKKIIK